MKNEIKEKEDLNKTHDLEETNPDSEKLDKSEKKKNISGVIVTIITGLIFFITIIILISGTISMKNGKIFSIFGYSLSNVPTESMVPTIAVDDIVIFKNVPYEDIEVNDIIVYYFAKDNINIVHRVIKINDDGTFLTKGDNNYLDDYQNEITKTYVNKDMYRGKMIYNGKMLGLGKLLRNGRNIIFFVAILIFMYVIVMEFINLIKTYKKKMKEEVENENQNIQEEYEKKKEQMRQELLEEMKTTKTSDQEDNNKHIE